MPNNKPRIAVDAMGGDFGPHMVVPGALHAARAGQAEVILVGDQDAIAAEMSRRDVKGLPISVVHASQVVEMDEKPSEAMRRKKDSSIQVACNLVRDGKADGVIHYGHTVRSAEHLLQLGADLSADVIPFLGHEISDEVIDLVIQRLCTYVPERTWREALRSAPR